MSYKANMNEIEKISIEFPLKGEWRFLRPPGHHPFAFDFVKMDDKRKKYSTESKIRFLLGNIPSTKYYCWEQPVYSPCDGVILQTGVEWKDHQETNIWKTIKIWYNATYKNQPNDADGKLDLRPNVGNYVMIKTGGGQIVFLAHLKCGTTTVKSGQIVKTGDLIGNVGNSGNSTAPHLHMNIFDQMDDPYTAMVLPFVFKEYQELSSGEKWETQKLNVPKIKSFIRSCL
ncbi:MAG: M23 family metallopeptidase [Gammaproteobacteria bacterium]|nr:M23 family metallopeptidase [Gammaproteobacteria bacterium]